MPKKKKEINTVFWSFVILVVVTLIGGASRVSAVETQVAGFDSKLDMIIKLLGGPKDTNGCTEKVDK